MLFDDTHIPADYMAIEIGSEFWDVPIAAPQGLFPENTEWFLSGRSALKAILAENQFKTAALPFWCCDSMILPFVEEGIELKFYDKTLPQADVALVLDHFGFSSSLDTVGFSGVIIRDLTHAVFSTRKEDAEYYFGSMRKWAGFWTGGFAWGFKKPISYAEDTTQFVSLRKKAMEWKTRYMRGETEDKGYLAVFSEAEEILERGTEILPAAPRDVEMMQRLDVALLVARRRENARLLLDAFSDIAIFPHLSESDCPLFVPILVPNGRRNALRKHLIECEIYCPVHWPISEYHSLNAEQRFVYENELSLVCDQRYTSEDMMRLIREVKSFLED